ncbi:MAG: MotA/TolQ/ExbB proton channel family protein [Candidatus Accumulibacter sp.]|jgi:biopolymer transport protein ExbB|nr:MotA/TolQ/ExbB proton channel family protein [Accumulibacter sp.]
MSWFALGGLLMWPLLLISVLCAAIIAERLLFYHGLAFPPKNLKRILQDALIAGRLDPALENLDALPLRDYRDALRADSLPNRETVLRLAGKAAVAKASQGLGALGLIGRIAPLVGLLGTIVGMMQTFSRIAQTHGAVDMPLLAGGIWQALITTAAGLVIAVPAVFARHFFLCRRDKIAEGLENLGNVALVLENRGCAPNGGHDA